MIVVLSRVIDSLTFYYEVVGYWLDGFILRNCTDFEIDLSYCLYVFADGSVFEASLCWSEVLGLFRKFLEEVSKVLIESGLRN